MNLRASACVFALIAGVATRAPAAPEDPKPAPPAPPPPSTGKEMPAKGPQLPTVEQAGAVLSRVIELAAKPSTDCKVLVNPRLRLAYQIAVPTKKNLTEHSAAWVAIGRCAEKEHYYKLELEIGAELWKATHTHAELAARGALGLERGDVAKAILVESLKKTPQDPNLLVTAAKLECKAHIWRDCFLHAGDAVKAADTLADKDEKLAVASRAMKYAARAALHLGSPDKADAFMALSEKLGGDKSDLTEIHELVMQAKLQQALVEPVVDPELPLGIYHLYGKVPDAGPLVKLLVTNLAKGDGQYKAEVAIDGVTQKAVQTVLVGKNQSKELVFNPPLLAEFKVASLRALRAAQISVKVTANTGGGDKVIYEQTLPINLQPRDVLPTIAFDGNDANHSTPWFYGAWITPNSTAVDAFLTKAKARAAGTFSGEQSDTMPQVKAIYDELRAQGMSYVMDPEVLANDARAQRIRLPSEVLATTNAQCLEGALLYATLLEAIGLRPIVVRVPGHAFVGWVPSAKDKLKAKLPSGMYFLETTMTHDAPFEQALNYGVGEFEMHKKKKEVTTFDVAKLRKLGVTPQPVD